MKKIISNNLQWVFTIGMFVTIITMWKYNNSLDELGVIGLLINMFLIVMLFSLFVAVISSEHTTKWLKRITIGIVVLIVVSYMSSCGVVREGGCAQHSGYIGYR